MTTYITATSHPYACRHYWRITSLTLALCLPCVLLCSLPPPSLQVLNKLLNECNFPSIAIYGGMQQEERISVYKQFKEGTKRILVSLSFAPFFLRRFFFATSSPEHSVRQISFMSW